MMNCSLRSPNRVTYESTITQPSSVCPGVQFTIRRMTLGRRMEMVRQVRECAKALEFHQAGTGLDDSLGAGLVACEIERIYLNWGLAGLQGLEIDGSPATTASLIESGPEPLCKEIAAAIKAE